MDSINEPPAESWSCQPSSTPPPRKKFATPPVKIACLSCRASRTRCDGGHPCSSCAGKARDCEYRPSRRGGPRFRKKSRLAVTDQPGNEAAAVFGTRDMEEQPVDSIPAAGFTDPGAGLRSLADAYVDSDALFDFLFLDPSNSDEFMLKTPMARTYGGSQAKILNAYYIWIHPYFPILPAPEAAPGPDEAIPLLETQGIGLEEPSSAIGLALSAILALIPCPQDSDSHEIESVRWRRNYSQFLAKAALESLENEDERHESSTEPSKALAESGDRPSRDRFHALVPQELESIIALDLLSVYEYAQRGNLKKQQARAGAAFMAAISLMLHIDTAVEDEYLEIRSRVWWMTYVCISQASITGNMAPTFEALAARITTRYPILDADTEAWPVFIQAQQAILDASKIVIDFNKARESGTGLSSIFDRMRDHESYLQSQVAIADTWSLHHEDSAGSGPLEANLACSLRCMAKIKLNSARIKIHRYCAFYDMAVFSTKHCDLGVKNANDTDAHEPLQLQSCCISVNSTSSPQTSISQDSPALRLSAHSTPALNDIDSPSQAPAPPFTSHQSSKICLGAALNISQAFESLPRPCATGAVTAPRTMPAFACCAMQGAYAMLMVREKTMAMYPQWTPGTNPFVDNLLQLLHQGLSSIWATLNNYASAFEALGGMRDQVREKLDSFPEGPGSEV